jgi:hypothetical protein
MEYHTGLPFGKFQPDQLEWKRMAVINTLAYYDTVTITAKKVLFHGPLPWVQT